MSDTFVFDVGSTLIHPDFYALSSWLESTAGIEASAEGVERAFRLAIHGCLREVRPKQDQGLLFFAELVGTAISPDRARALWREVELSGGSNSWLYTVVDRDAASVLAELKGRGHQLIAASNSDGTLIDELASFNLAHFFHEVHDSTLLGFEKPDRRFYKHVLASVRGGRAVHVGDDLVNDCIAAAAFGFNDVLLYDRAGLLPGLPPRLRIARLIDILPYVDGVHDL